MPSDLETATILYDDVMNLEAEVRRLRGMLRAWTDNAASTIAANDATMTKLDKLRRETVVALLKGPDAAT